MISNDFWIPRRTAISAERSLLQDESKDFSSRVEKVRATLKVACALGGVTFDALLKLLWEQGLDIESSEVYKDRGYKTAVEIFLHEKTTGHKVEVIPAKTSK